MKAFDKLYGKRPKWDEDFDGYIDWSVRREAWKEALKWLYSIDTDGCNEGFSCWLKVKIDEELRDE